MGQAKARGTFEERKAQAIARIEVEQAQAAERRRLADAERAKRREEERARVRRDERDRTVILSRGDDINTMQLLAILAATGAAALPRSRK